MATSLPTQEIGSSLGRDARFDALAGRLKAFEGSEAAATPEEQAQQRAELRQAAQDFEALFLNLLVREMRPKSEGGLFGDGLGSEIYEDLFDTELSKVMSKTGQLGLAEMIEKQVSMLLGLEDPQDGVISGTTFGRSLPKQIGRAAVKTYRTVEKSVKEALEKLIRPVVGPVSSSFGLRTDPIDGAQREHKGVDIAVAKGTPVKAAADGKVVFSSSAPGYGNMVIVEHADGFESRYAHNDNNFVSKGEEVKAGQVVASVGESGRSTGPHLHFEVRKDGDPIDPLTLLP